jgi:hypothetical protein
MGKVKKWFGGGGDNGAAEAERRMREQQERDRIERENRLMLEGSTGADTAASSGNVQTGYADYSGGGVRRKKRVGDNVSASLGIG